MTRRASTDRQAAALLLGVGPDADPSTVRRAFRAWASLAHPDAGGDAAHFAALCDARDILLTAPPPSIELVPVPRPALRDVLRRPDSASAAVAVTVIAIAIAVSVIPSWRGISAASVLPAMVLAVVAAWCVPRAVLGDRADMAHRVVVSTLAWLVVVGAQLVMSALAGTSLLPVMPLMAIPLVATVSLVLAPGAGLLLARH
ncbi:MAG: J domain-containing protein [Candidatus Nanopelagicales bacterium]